MGVCLKFKFVYGDLIAKGYQGIWRPGCKLLKLLCPSMSYNVSFKSQVSNEVFAGKDLQNSCGAD